MTTGHNHPPRCCCSPAGRDVLDVRLVRCPQCVEHGELAQLSPPDCSTCHAHHGQPHTDYCHAGGIVGADPRADRQCDNPEPHTSHIRFDDSPHNVCPGRLVHA